jgi:hypothetical protein
VAAQTLARGGALERAAVARCARRGKAAAATRHARTPARCTASEIASAQTMTRTRRSLSTSIGATSMRRCPNVPRAISEGNTTSTDKLAAPSDVDSSSHIVGSGGGGGGEGGGEEEEEDVEEEEKVFGLPRKAVAEPLATLLASQFILFIGVGKALQMLPATSSTRKLLPRCLNKLHVPNRGEQNLPCTSPASSSVPMHFY